MIEDLDEELVKIKAEGILVTGEGTGCNPSLVYCCGCIIPRWAIFVKKIGSDPLLVVSDLDVGSARKGIVKNIKTFSQYNVLLLDKEHGENKETIILHDILLKEAGVKKRVVLGGKMEAGTSYVLVRRLRRKKYVVLTDPSIIERVRRTKSSHELDLISQVAKRTESVVCETLDMLRECPVSGDTLQSNGKPLTVADVKVFIHQRLAALNLLAVQGIYFAPGPEGADPHNPGSPDSKIKTRTPIILDIFPRDIKTGYWFDTTRTFVIGQAPSQVEKAYEDVKEAQQAALDQMHEGASSKDITRSVYQLLEDRNHKTPLYYIKHPKTRMEEGMIHSLGHGVGLTLDDLPNLNLVENSLLKMGDVISVEPGIYYPYKWGIRIEDTVTILKDGIRNFSTLDKTLEL